MNIQMMKTRLSPEFLTQLGAANPCMEFKDAAGRPNGNVRLPVARLSFANLARPGKNNLDPSKEGKYGANLLFLPNADLNAARQARARVLAEKFPNNPQGMGMKDPFRDQADRVAPAQGGRNPKGQSTSGYVPGSVFMAPTSNRPVQLFVPPIVNGIPTVFVGGEKEIEREFYSGCWVIAVINFYASTNAQNPGVFAGLQQLLKVADDNEFQGTSSVDPRTAFGGVNISQDIQPSSLF